MNSASGSSLPDSKLRATLSLAAAGEPFRLLFPLGTALGILGVLLWPLYVLQGIDLYPGLAHARLMIHGFLTAFVLGFLGTALPRMLEVPRLGLWPTSLAATSLILLNGLHLAGRHATGDLLFLILFASFLALLLQRARQRQDVPPPGFVLVGLGMLCALAGTALFFVYGVVPQAYDTTGYSLARLLLYQGFILLPVMGIGAFLLPRFFGLPSRHNLPESLTLSPAWKARAGFALLCGVAVLLSFLLEALGYFRFGYGLRAAAVFGYFLREVPVHQAAFSQGSLALALRIALFAIPFGYFLMMLLPSHQSGLVHVVFITGFSLLTFTVASRVILGHSGQSEKFRQVIKPVLWMTALLVLAMLLRIGADATAAGRLHGYATAALLWAIGACIWAGAVLPSVARADDE